MFWLVFALIFLFLIGLILHNSTKHMRDAVHNIPGPYCLPVLGAIYLAVKLDPKSVFEEAFKMHLKYGTIMRLFAFNRLLVFIGDTELTQQILSSPTHISKHPSYNILEQWLGRGLLISDGKKWHRRRKIITPTFHFQILQQFVEVFNQQAAVLVKCLSSRADEKMAFDVFPLVCSATLDIIAETAMGTKVNAQTNASMKYTAAVNELTKLMSWRFMRLPLNNELIFSVLYPFKKFRQTQLIRTVHEFTSKVIEERRQTLKETLENTDKESQNEDLEIGDKKSMALLDVLLQSTIEGEPLSDVDIREEVNTFMFEGHDTTASAISFALYLLSRHPQVQNKALEEITLLVGNDHSKSLTIQELSDLKYLECVIKESLRVYPSVPIIGRQMKEDFKYTHSVLGDGILPAGTEILIPFFAMFTFNKTFENTEDFVPERHLNADSMDNNYFIPFSAGPRNCIGQKFAMLEMKVILVKILKEYQILPMGEPVKPELNIVMRSTNGIQIGLRRRLQ